MSWEILFAVSAVINLYLLYVVSQLSPASVFDLWAAQSLNEAFGGPEHVAGVERIGHALVIITKSGEEFYVFMHFEQKQEKP